ncbi:hypothetical protein DID88_004478 [Monilinia fructigena]|uniref:SSD domain-containing protein n=1 Tax=Monilinia fructigena TaxID=38457 RepID=A0A395IQU0_9HELO|nr:hypothetical protein DID88_004478 [Monilinia fructigena]
MDPLPMVPKKCNDEDENFRCSCVDCPAVCPALPEVSKSGSCHVGYYHAFPSQLSSPTVTALEDVAPSDDDDDDEGDVVHNRAMYDRPQRNYWINAVCDGAFSRLAYTAARFPAITIVTSIVVVAILSLGWTKFEIEQNPARLWVSPSSSAAQEKAYFDSNFGPFYRAETSILGQRYEFIWSRSCHDITPDTWEKTVRSCAESPVNCRPAFGQPLDPKMIFGGWQESGNVIDATALIITWVVKNDDEGSAQVEHAMDWEASLRDELLHLQNEANEPSIGLFSFAGVKVTLIIAEVIPFIVLAVGVDNIFLIVHEFEKASTKDVLRDRRVDCVPCIQIKSAEDHLGDGNGSSDEGFPPKVHSQNLCSSFIGRNVKTAVVVVFLGIFAAAVALIPEVALGLDQRVAIPDGSYLIPYFNDLYDYFDSGPPVYFVTRELNVTERKHQQQLCSRFTTCETESLANILESERKRPEISYIAATPASWIDDYFRWLDPSLDSCCVEGGSACFENRDPAWNITLNGMPEGQEFIHYLEKWIASPTDGDCPLGGQAAYGNALVIDTERDTIPASHFRTSHTPLHSQEDFIAAYASARRIADGMSEKSGLEVFPYSVYYIFLRPIHNNHRINRHPPLFRLVLILFISSILLGSLKTGAVVTVTVIMIVTDIIGTMAIFNVSLNAVSLVNLIICVGIGVEFCAHIARAFMFPSRTVMDRAKNKFRNRDARAWTALVNVGGSVFSGITITKLVGVSVLAFNQE